MAAHVFSEEAIAELSANPYVLKVTKHNIYFSAGFKQLYLKRMCDGVSDEAFFYGIGIDPALLGERRIAGIKHNIRQVIRDGRKLTDPVLKGGPQSLESTAEKTVSLMKHEIAYLRQENEFLKKIISASAKEDK